MKNKTFIIGEAGINHNGVMADAYKLIDIAKAAGVDAVKFQTGRPEMVVTNWASKADYQKVTTGKGETQQDMIKKFALPFAEFNKLQDYCHKKDIIFFSTPFENAAATYLNSLRMDIFKIPSGEINNLPFLRLIASFKKQTILSTGMASMQEIEQALKVLCSHGLTKDQITVLHCNTEYPTPMDDVNLKAMLTIRDRLNVKVGYSDHTMGIEVPIAAVALGATVIEKHFTIDRSMPGPDQKASLEPQELAEMVRTIRNIELAISGSGEKVPSPSEKKNIKIARRSIVASTNIVRGELLTEENLVVKRPGTGINPMQWDKVIGTKAVRNFLPDELIEI